MDEMKSLTERFWIVREKDHDLYTGIVRATGTFRRFTEESLGWRLIVNEKMVKLEKIPAHAESFMGITDFMEVRDYCIFCALLIFLEDKEDGEQFLLSELVDMLEVLLKGEMSVDWTMFTQRKSLIRVLKFSEDTGILKVYDGSSDSITGGMGQEVLYENTGLSRYFATVFSHDISGYGSYHDFEKEPVTDEETERGRYRINRVYRTLVTGPAVYWGVPDDQDAYYLKNQRKWISKNLYDAYGASLQVQKNAAFLMMPQEDSFGEYFPREIALAGIVLFVCKEIREKYAAGVWHKENNDCIMIRPEESELVLLCREKYAAGWSKEYREMSGEELIKSVADFMEAWMMILRNEDSVTIFPAAGKFSGFYPKDFKQGDMENNA